MTTTGCVCPNDRTHTCFNANCPTSKPFHHTQAGPGQTTASTAPPSPIPGSHDPA